LERKAVLNHTKFRGPDCTHDGYSLLAAYAGLRRVKGVARRTPGALPGPGRGSGVACRARDPRSPARAGQPEGLL